MGNVGIMRMNLQGKKRGLFSRVFLSTMKLNIEGNPITYSECDILSWISSFPECCRSSYEQLKELFGCSYKTIYKSIKRLVQAGYIEKVERDKDGTGYKLVKRLGKCREYNIVPLYLNTAEICVDGTWRKMTKSEKRVATYIAKCCSSKKNEAQEIVRDEDGLVWTDKEFSGSVRQIARKLNLCMRTVRKAIGVLQNANIIKRKITGTNTTVTSRYIVNIELYAYKEYGKQTLSREEFYRKNKESAENRAGRYNKLANQNAGFRAINVKLNGMEYKIGYAEAYKPEDIELLKAEKEHLIKERRRILSSLGIDENDLKIHYHCLKCKDTGNLNNGHICDCYKKE